MRWLAVVGSIVATVAFAKPPAAKPKPPKPAAVDLLVSPDGIGAPLLALAPLGTPESELAKKLPAYDRGIPASVLRDALVLPEVREGKLVGYWINGLDYRETPPALARFRAAWGEPQSVDNPIGRVHIWLDAKARVALYVQVVKTTDKKDHSNLFLRPYTPLAELLGDKPGELAPLRKRPLLGATKAELVTAYGRAVSGNRLELGAFEWENDFDITFELDQDRVVRYTVRFTHGTTQNARADGDRILQHLVGKVPAENETVTLGKTSARIYRYKDSWSLHFEPAKP